MMKFIEQETHGRVALGAGTLYGAIETLLKKGWIRPVETDAEHGKKEYLLTETGRKIAGAESARLSELEKLARRILGGEAS